MSPSKTRMYLVSLIRTGIIAQEPQGSAYSLGPYAITLGVAALDQLDLFNRARQVMELIGRSREATCPLCTWTGIDIIIIGRSEWCSPQASRWPGTAPSPRRSGERRLQPESASETIRDKGRALSDMTGGQLELRARGFYTAVREPEVIHRKKPDIVVYRTQIDARVPIEVKVVDKLSGTAVIKAFKKQLISQYQRDRNATHGILLLIGLKESKSWNLGGRHVRGIENLGKAVRELGLKDTGVRRKGIRADVVTLRLWDSSILN